MANNNFPSRKYLGAIYGTYNHEYFIEPLTKKFRFPNYNKDIKNFLVKVKDVTRYREYYFDSYSKEEKQRFTFNDFEETIILPEFEVEDFGEFLDSLNKSHFDKKIGKPLTLELFSLFEEYLNNELDKEPIFVQDEYQKAVFAGYLDVNMNLKFSKLEYLNEQTKKRLTELCIENNLAASGDSQIMKNRLLQIDFKTPNYIAVTPSERLKDYFESLAHLYIMDLRNNTDRFHPLFIKSIWDEAVYSNYGSLIEKLINSVISTKYWENRLVEKWT